MTLQMDRLGPYELNQIYTGDARELAKAIPDESVDLIFTDPPYPKEFLPLYGWLAEEAGRILRPGGWLFAYGAGEYLPDHLSRLGKHLNYFWVFVLLHNDGHPRMWHKRLFSGYKPVMVYTKGHPKLNPWKTTVYIDAKDKRFHKWGQGIILPLKMLEMLTGPDGIIFDPMCGGGTVPAACKMLGRRWLAFEIDPDTAEAARRRVAQTQPPLFVERPEQLTMREVL